MLSKRKHVLKKFVNRKLRMRLRIFAIIILALLVLIGYDFFTGVINLPLALSGIAIGIVIGFFVGRMFKVMWHEGSNTVVSRMDLIGVIVLAFYLVFTVFRNQIFSEWITGPVLGAFGFCVIAGTLIGRLWGTRIAILHVLYRKGIIKRKNI